MLCKSNCADRGECLKGTVIHYIINKKRKGVPGMKSAFLEYTCSFTSGHSPESLYGRLSKLVGDSADELRLERTGAYEYILTVHPGYRAITPRTYISLEASGAGTEVRLRFTDTKFSIVFTRVYLAFCAVLFVIFAAVGGFPEVLIPLGMAAVCAAMEIFGLKLSSRAILKKLCAAFGETCTLPLHRR